MGWFVLHVGPRTEKRVAAVCAKYHLPHYLPLREEIRFYQRRKVCVQNPLFTGYLFADVTPETRLHVMRTNHVLQLIEPPDEKILIQELWQVRMALAADPGVMSDAGLCRGVRVRIKAGAFMGIEGVVDFQRSASLVRLNVELVGQSVRVDVDRDFLEILAS